MSRFYHNRGMGMGMGMGMNNFNPRRGGGPGGPMRGGFMGNQQQIRNQPYQNQNRRGGFNKPTPHQPAPTPGPALTMKAPVKEENKGKPAEQPKQQANTPAAALPATPKIPSPPPKPTATPQATPSKPQEQQSKPGTPANVNGQQPKQTPPPATPQQAPNKPQQQPQSTPKPFQSANKPIPQAPKPTPPQQAPKPATQQAPVNKPPVQQQAPKPVPPQQTPPKPPHQQLQNQANRAPPQQQQHQGPRGGGHHPGQQGGPPRPHQQHQAGPRQGPPFRQGQRGGHNQRGGFHQRPGPQHHGRPSREQEEPKPMETEEDSGEDRPKVTFKLSMLLKPGEKSYTQRCRLFVGNMPNDITEDEFKEMFAKYGYCSEVFINKAKGFGFIRLESRALAEIAKSELDDTLIKGRPLRVRFATHSAALSIKNLSPFVSNELLEEAFSQFGLVERAIVIVDDRGRSTGKGLVEFASKPAARKALDRCNDGVFLLTSSPRPVVVEPLEQFDDEDGLPEKLAQKNPRYQVEREHPPRFAHPGSFEFEYSKRWKSLDEMEKQQRQQVEKNMQEAREKLESEMEDAFHEHQANLLRQDLLRRQEELRRMEEMHSQEMQKRKEMQLRQEEERRRREEELLRKREMEEQMRRQREESYRMGGNFMDREREMRLSSSGTLGMGDMSYSASSQKFNMSGMSFEGQQGISGSPSLMSSEMRSDRYAQSSARGMGAGNGGYGRVREEFDAPAKKARF